MAIVRYTSPLSRMLNRWPDIWDDDFFSGSSIPANSGLEVYETEKEVTVKANVAGVPEDKIEVTFEKGVLYITAEAQEESRDGKTHYARNSWSYSYKVAVPGEVDQAAEPQAKIRDGVLTVNFAKSVQAQPKTLRVQRE